MWRLVSEELAEKVQASDSATLLDNDFVNRFQEVLVNISILPKLRFGLVSYLWSLPAKFNQNILELFH